MISSPVIMSCCECAVSLFLNNSPHRIEGSRAEAGSHFLRMGVWDGRAYLEDNHFGGWVKSEVVRIVEGLK